jgi:hypothetical protein
MEMGVVNRSLESPASGTESESDLPRWHSNISSGRERRYPVCSLISVPPYRQTDSHLCFCCLLSFLSPSREHRQAGKEMATLSA